MLVPQKLNIKLPYDSVILLLGTYPGELKVDIETICAHNDHSGIIPNS